MDREGTNDALCTILATTSGEKESMVMILHCRMGHISFDKMYKVFPNVMCGVDKNKLFCDACEFAKHTRSSYVSRGIRNVSPFVLIHSDVWTCPVVSISGMRYFVTFIDCFSRMIWVYLMKHKDEVLKCFQDFCALVKTQFNTQVQTIRTDNGTEYVNKEFGAFLSANGILH
jgi:transposase InsO family protein